MTLLHAWNTFRDTVLGDMPQEDMEGARRIFYAGAAAGVDQLVRSSNAAAETLGDELEAFRAAMQKPDAP